MINFDFDYYRPESSQEAVEVMQGLISQKKSGLYYGGGTEILSNFRKGKLKADAVIDLKTVDGLVGIVEEGDYITVGASTPLNQIVEFNGLNALTGVIQTIADHTIRNTLTIGGNICGRLPYKEAVLPLLAANAQLEIFGVEGARKVLMRDVFQRRMALEPTEFVYKIRIPKESVERVYTQRETVATAVDYPILHLYGRLSQNELFVGLSGFAAYPVYEIWSKEDLNPSATDEARHERLMEAFRSQARTDERGTAEYRVRLLDVALQSMLKTFEGGLL